ncbi:hypothetical protein RNI52_34460 [Labrys neptuniae]|uniref:hypothetical protein n=1 Tax=Labrys neptuniae TaxID=376174 RepID=UPI00288F9588|nr:hypothetical protein [Labrys neptuniae]MDT3382480.1 hypothetical protein [Labrys neptuniae]
MTIDAEEKMPTNQRKLNIIELFALGSLGGILPIVASLVTADLAPIIDHPEAFTIGNYIGYGIRVVALIILGGVMTSLNKDVIQPLALVQIGIAAPALVTSYISGSTALPPKRPAVQAGIFSTTAHAGEVAPQTGQIQLAGGFLGDVVQGFSMPPSNIAQGRMGPPSAQPQLSTSPPLMPPQGYPANGTPNSLGNFCTTPIGRFGPGPLNQIGSPCFVNTPNGPIPGNVSP